MTQPITVTNTGVNIAFGAASANVAIPNSGNVAPRYVRLTATAACYVKVGNGAGTAAVAGDLLVQPADSISVRTIGLTHIAALQVTVGGILQISPLDDA